MLPKNATLPCLFFFALMLFYYSLTPGAIAGMGYSQENIEASNQIISNLAHWLTLRPATTTVVFPRHGLYEPILEIPFILVGRLAFGPSFAAADRGASLQPIVFTSFICTLILIWARRLTGSELWGYVLALTAALSTLFWPYAYIGLEPSQSLFLLLSGFTALSCDRKRGWPLTLAFACSCGLAVSVKSTGLFLIPAIAFLLFCYFRPVRVERGDRDYLDWKKVAAAIAVVATLYLVNDHRRALSATSQGGALAVFKTFGIRNPLAFFVNMFSLVVSVNKGLLIFSPPILLCLLALRRVFRERPRLAVFAILVLLGLMGGASMLWCWTDETWGPRYLHAAIGPLMVCLAVTRREFKFRWRKEIPLLILVISGMAVSFLGAVFYYGNLQGAAMMSSHATIEKLQYDPNWNHIRFNAQLMRIWLQTRAAGAAVKNEPWPPAEIRWYPGPNEAPLVETKQVDLNMYAVPLPAITRGTGPATFFLRVYRAGFVISFLLGAALLVWLGRKAARDDRRVNEIVSSP